ncbi:MAG: hypothetical protein Kow0029_18500 [Candidatus Rifleibacteriota bacterium]
MGQVFKAIDVNLGREVAIKFLLPEIAKDEEIVKRFLNEGRIMATINHPAVISVYASDVEETKKIPFLVMEFVSGKSLAQCQESLKKKPEELINHFIQLLSGIHACHQKGIIHRDLKPENLLINDHGQLKILDFGIAKSASRQTKTGIALGTPHYMSPEQCLGKNDITAKTDVYAAGIMLYEIIAGTLPFKIDGHVDDPALSIALMHLNQSADFTEFSKHPMGDDFRSLVERMIAKKPEDRPEVPEILEELKLIRKRLIDSEKPTVAKAAVSVSGENMIGEIYEIQAELGSGGMGKVLKALDTSLNRIVAIKLLHENAARDKSLVDRFIHEGQVLATVGHRNVMGIYASSRDRRTGKPFLVMEYVEGKSLAEVKDTLGNDRTKAVPIMLQIAEGLSACHEKGIIHRDLKPSNIIINNAGLVKILDFGIAKTGANLTKTGMTVGTPEYMSPEQCTGSKNISCKSDIYSLGIIFWELIFGQVPFKADANTNPELSIALKHIEATLPAQAAIPDMSLIKIISLTRKMLNKDPEARPDLDEIIETLEAYIEEHLPDALSDRRSDQRSLKRSSRIVSELIQQDKKTGRNSKRVALFAFLLLIAAAGIIIYKSEILKSPIVKDYEKEINDKIAAGDFTAAKNLLNDFQETETGKARSSFLKLALSRAMISKADDYARDHEYQQAINLYAQAIVLDPANPQAALNLSRLQQEMQEAEQLKAQIETLQGKAKELLSLIGPASGTDELNACLTELKNLGQASFSAEIEARWQTTFIASASPYISNQPEKALQYLQDLQKFFPNFEGIKELSDKAVQRSEELKKELANADKLNSLLSAISAAIDNYTSTQNTDFLVKQISKVEELGNKTEADNLRKKLAVKILEEADKFIVNDPEKAIMLLNSAERTFPDLEGVQTRMQLASESLATLKSSEEMRLEREALIKEISAEIESINPPDDIASITAKLARLEKYDQGTERARKLKRKLFEKYFTAISSELEKSPDTARKILNYCFKLNPNAPGLKELEKNIEEKIKLEQDRKKAEEKKIRAKRLETAKNAIYTGIKKDPIPEDLEKIHTEISALSLDYPDSDAPEKLFGHLQKRCRDEISDYIRTNVEKAQQTIDIARKLFADDKDFVAFLDSSQRKLAEKKKIEELKKAVASQQKEIEAFLRSPSADAAPKIYGLIQEIEKAVSKEEADKELATVIKSLERRFYESDDPAEAQKNYKILAAFDKNYEDKFDLELKKLASSKLQPIEKFADKFVPSIDTSELQKKLRIMKTWNSAESEARILNSIRKNYITEATKLQDSDPEQAFELLNALSRIDEFAKDRELINAMNNLKKMISGKKSDTKINEMINTANSIIDQGNLEQSSEKLFQIIEYLDNNSPEQAKILRDRIVASLLRAADSSLKSEDLRKAEQKVALACQFDPGSDKAIKLQIRITEEKKALQKPKDFIVGPTGNFKTIAEAIKAAPDNATIKIQPGSYNENLNISKSVNLVGASEASCSINSKSGDTLIINGNCSISKLTLTNSSNSPAATILVNGGNPAIANCVISNASPAKPPEYIGAITVKGGSPHITGNNIISSKAMGITVTGGSPVISKNLITGCQIYGIWFNGAARGQITENTIKGNLKSGIGIKNHASPSLTANIVEGNGENGLFIYSNASGRYERNRISNNNYSGIEVWDAQPASIRNNTFDGNNRDALYIRGNKSLVKLGNNIFKNTRGQEVKHTGGKIESL